MGNVCRDGLRAVAPRAAAGASSATASDGSASTRRTDGISSGANVTTAPSTPAPISVLRTPMAELTGPASA